MMGLLRKIWRFTKKPRYRQYKYPPKLRKRLFVNLLGINLLVAFCLGMVTGIFESITGFDPGEHMMGELFDEPPLYIFFLVVIFAPLVEEAIFRGPLIWFRNSKYFPWAFYISVVLFGAVHLFNFEQYDETLWAAPLLVSPQLFTGIVLGYTRIRMGIRYSILMHACFNAILLGPFIIMQTFKPLFE